ncbi:hypothetical protein FE257_006157 [Aspergillus nanangensis]|uniref:Uncharacterized protein n=1 Tax=Aspergillus nanangensis TaxID=2582783 RepID=A0AAD4GV26_ASPNN|nr:hypothetical protein FE257_006157 [Aspergillus nanangensis]
MLTSLSTSRWAPPPPTPTTPGAEKKNPPRQGLLSPAEELARLKKIVARLKWKLPFLGEGYRVATLRTAPPDDVRHAQIMFKLDFHEYYALLERALVHLLGVFGMTVPNTSSTAKKGYGMGNGNGAGGYSHRYHANVIEALERRSCPLREVFGAGDRLRNLRRAKELRNRWKTADLSLDDNEPGQQQDEWSGVAKNEDRVSVLESYDIENILSEIFDALGDGYRLAEAHLLASQSQDEAEQDRVDDAEVDWDFIVDAMDWEAV